MKKVILTIVASLALTGASYAGSYGVGVTGSLAKVNASGSEKKQQQEQLPVEQQTLTVNL